ncbi:MAG: FAD-dependent oxidoreductase [Magnetospirillum sp.]|nr:FAD-dependent oxidoreductase [Magnetospirillum sp.]
MDCDYLVVGAGLTGATMARVLADQGQRVLVVDRRPHLGGNVHDFAHPSGIRVHAYGPHYFRTSSQEVWDFVTRFGDFYPFEAVLMSHVDGRFEHWPVQDEYIRRTLGDGWRPSPADSPANFEEASLAMMPRPIYEKFVKSYTEKQWGVEARTLSADLAGRFDVRIDGDVRLKGSRWQGIPLDGYAGLMERMLAGVPVLLNTGFAEIRSHVVPRKLTIHSGSIDEYFGFDLGRLQYRAQRREHEYMPGVDRLFPAPQVNFPAWEDGPHIRAIEWKQIMPAQYRDAIKGTVVTREYPYTPTSPAEYEYPFPDARQRALYRRYAERAATLPGVLFCGRLGEYRYYDMDQAIGRAMMLVRRLLQGSPVPALAP